MVTARGHGGRGVLFPCVSIVRNTMKHFHMKKNTELGSMSVPVETCSYSGHKLEWRLNAIAVVSGAFPGLFQTSTPLTKKQIISIAVVYVKVKETAQVLKKSSTSAGGFGDVTESQSQKPIPL